MSNFSAFSASSAEGFDSSQGMLTTPRKGSQLFLDTFGSSVNFCPPEDHVVIFSPSTRATQFSTIGGISMTSSTAGSTVLAPQGVVAGNIMISPPNVVGNIAMAGPGIVRNAAVAPQSMVSNFTIASQNVAGGTQMPLYPSLEATITNLPLQNILCNADVYRLFIKNTTLLNAKVALSSEKVTLSSENATLKIELANVQRELADVRSQVQMMEGNRLHPDQRFPSPVTLLTKRSSEESIDPSDSASQCDSKINYPLPPKYGHFPADYPAECPANFPPDVLWTINKCHKDVNAYKNNRIILSAAIHNKDGTPFHNVEAIKNTARIHFLSSLAHLPIPPCAPKCQTGLWWRKHCPEEWKAAIQHLKLIHPVVAYCAYHWKAEEIYRYVIQTRLDSDRSREESRGLESGTLVEPLDVSILAALKKRPRSITNSSANQPAPEKEQPKQSILDVVSKPAKKKRKKVPSDAAPLSTLPPLSVSPAMSSSAMAHFGSAKQIDASKLTVPSTVEALDKLVSEEFPWIKDSTALFNAFKASPKFSVGSTSDELAKWLQVVDAADPNNPTLDEDNNFEQWGHRQLSLSSPTLTSWSAVGNVNFACHLISVLVKTCKVAREICLIHERKVTTSFIADCYLNQTIETLWKLWTTYKAEHPDVDSPTALQTPQSPSPRSPLMSSPLALPDPPSSPPSPSSVLPSPALVSPVPVPPSLSQKSVQSLKLEELKELIKVRCISVSVTKLKKEDYVKAILCASNEKQPTEADIVLIVAKHGTTKKITRSAGGKGSIA